MNATTRTPTAKRYSRQWEVQGSNGSEYVVSQGAIYGEYSCSCPAWKFHKAPKPDCKHILAILAEIEQTSKAVSKPAPDGFSDLYRTTLERIITSFSISDIRLMARQALQAGRATTSVTTTVSGELFTIKRKFRAEEE